MILDARSKMMILNTSYNNFSDLYESFYSISSSYNFIAYIQS